MEENSHESTKEPPKNPTEERRTSTVGAASGPLEERKVRHPFRLRLTESSGLPVNSPLALASAGYASIALGLFSSFRVTPFLLFVLTYYYKDVSPVLTFNKVALYVLLFTWAGAMRFVLIVLGLVLAASQKVSKRWPLLLHPWALLLLYVDIFFWLSLILWMHLQVVIHPELTHRVFAHLYQPLSFFIIMYVDCVLFGVLYYLFATYFIAVELTVIERFF